MPETPKSADVDSDAPVPSEVQDSERKQEEEMGEFIRRAVLEKDSVFFEG